jgi:hypothetical protein
VGLVINGYIVSNLNLLDWEFFWEVSYLDFFNFIEPADQESVINPL